MSYFNKENIKDIYALSPMQAGMLYHSLLDETSEVYFEQTTLTIKGNLDLNRIEQSFNQLIQRHEILRTVFIYKKIEKPMQVVMKEWKAKVYFEDIIHLIQEEKKQFIEEFKNQDRKKGFDLKKDISIRIAALKTGDDSYCLIWSFHHIIMDGWCLGIIAKEFFEIYEALKENQPLNLEKTYPYSEYIKWLEARENKAAASYWEEYLEGYEQLASLPKQKSVPLDGDYRQEEISFAISGALREKLEDIAKNNNVTLNTIIQTLWGIILQHYNNADDIVFGAVVSGRPYDITGIEKMVGLFINTIPVRIKSVKNKTFTELLHETQQSALQSEAYSYYPLAEIQSLSKIKQNLVDHIVVFENYPLEETITANTRGKAGLVIENVEIFEQTNYNFNLMVVLGMQLIFKLSYNALVYERNFIEKIEGHFKSVVHCVINNPAIAVGGIAILSAAEKKQILIDFNDTKGEYPRDKTFCALFAEQVAKTPSQIAVIFGAEQLTYRELDKKANRLANYLKIEHQIGADSLVGVLMERSSYMLEAILGILKSGGAYVPIDPEYPEERIQSIIEDSGINVLVSMEKELKILNRLQERCQAFKAYLCLDGNAVSLPETKESETSRQVRNGSGILEQYPVTFACSGLSPDSLAYVIYTSGSTGKPKGVMVEHVGMLNHLQAKINDLKLNKDSIIAQNASHCFDISVWQFLVGLMVGGKVIIYPDDLVRDPKEFMEQVIKDRITVLEVVPSFLAVVLDDPRSNYRRLEALTYLIVTGETVKAGLVREWFLLYPGIKMMNAYGPTEASDDITHYIMDRYPGIENIPIGKPIINMKIYIVDQGMNLCPVGVYGEICVSGIGVGRGYLKNPEKTGAVFMDDPFTDQKGVRLYKTGDLGRWMTDGNIEFMGRKDHQVKIRGFRIELGEIENKLAEHPEIKEAIVIDQENDTGDKYLCAYFVAVNELEISGIRRYLLSSLPNYMVPSFFIQLAKLPLTPNGKIDRKALPEPVGNLNPGIEYEAPRNDIERKLLEIWREVLKVERVGIHDNFFELGGHSLKATALVAKIHRDLNVNLLLREVFINPTIAEIAGIIKSNYEQVAEIDKILEEVEAL